MQNWKRSRCGLQHWGKKKLLPPCQRIKPANRLQFIIATEQLNDSTSIKSSWRHANLNVRVPQNPERSSCQRWLHVTLVKCHVQSAARLISVSHFHALLMEAGITRNSVSAACAYMFLWSHPLSLDKAVEKRQIIASILGLRENVHTQKDKMIFFHHTIWSSECRLINKNHTKRKKTAQRSSYKHFFLFWMLVQNKRFISVKILCSPKTLLKWNVVCFLEPDDVTLGTRSWLLKIQNLYN